MRDEHDTAARVPPHAAQIVLQGVARELIQRGKRLVHQQHARCIGQGTGQRDAHAHATRQLSRPGGLESGQAHTVQRRHGTTRLLGTGHAVQAQRQTHVVERARPRQQRRVLEHNTQLRHPVPRDGSLIRAVQPGDQPQQRALAATGRPQQRHELTIGHCQRRTGQRHGPVWVTPAHAVQPQH